MEKDRVRQATLRDRAEGPAADGHGRVMGNLALAGGRKNSQLHHHHHPPNELFAELADWRVGRNAVYQLAALTVGARLAVADA
jgi:hypothetical protein